MDEDLGTHLEHMLKASAVLHFTQPAKMDQPDYLATRRVFVSARIRINDILLAEGADLSRLTNEGADR